MQNFVEKTPFIIEKMRILRLHERFRMNYFVIIAGGVKSGDKDKDENEEKGRKTEESSFQTHKNGNLSFQVKGEKNI